MKTCRLMFAVGALLALCLSQPALADGWWPFGSKEEPAKTSKIKGSKKKSSKAAAKPASSGTLSNIATGTKNAVSNTASGTKRAFTSTASGAKKLVTNPASLVTPAKKPASPENNGASTRKSRQEKAKAKDKKEEPGILKRMFAGDPEPPPPKSIKEWMSLKRNDP